MIEKCASKIADWMIQCEVIEESDWELYKYAVYNLILSLFPLVIIFVVSIYFKCVIQSTLIIIPLMTIRKYSGGFHAKTPGICLIVSLLLIFFSVSLSFFIRGGWILALITLVAVVSLIYFSPIDNENRRLEYDEYCHCKKITGMLVVLFMLMASIFYYIRLYQYSVCINTGIILSAGLQLPCICDAKNVKNDQKR